MSAYFLRFARHRFPLGGLLLAIVAGAASPASEIHVPKDYPTLQAAIYAAQPGDVIVAYVESDPVVIDKALTILGASISNSAQMQTHEPPIRLAGPADGKVVLSEVHIGSDICNCHGIQPCITGGGFSELHILDSDIRVPFTCISGAETGADAVHIDVPLLLVSGSTIRGGIDCTDQCSTWGIGGLDGIDAPASTVIVLDSLVQGGSPIYACCYGCECERIAGVAAGGNGVVAAQLFVAGSTIEAGKGSPLYTVIGVGEQVLCGYGPDGEATVVGTLSHLPGSLSGSGPAKVGSTWTLGYDTTGPLAFLGLDFTLANPTLYAGVGFAFLDPATAIVLGPIPVGVGLSLDFAIPAVPGVVGIEAIFQILDSSDGLSRPVVSLIVH